MTHLQHACRLKVHKMQLAVYARTVLSLCNNISQTYPSQNVCNWALAADIKAAWCPFPELSASGSRRTKPFGNFPCWHQYFWVSFLQLSDAASWLTGSEHRPAKNLCQLSTEVLLQNMWRKRIKQQTANPGLSGNGHQNDACMWECM